MEDFASYQFDGYGRTIDQAVANATLLLCLDLKPEEKEPLLVNYTQYAIDLWGAVKNGFSGWVAHGASAAVPTGFDTFTADALDAYKLYVVEVRHPVEVPGSERTHMTQWLSKRLDSDLRIPDLQSIGLKLVGGRLLPGPTGAAAFYMYEGPSGERFTIYCAKAATPETALRFKEGQRFAAFYWVDDKVAYAVSGPADRTRLEQVAKTVYEQVDKSGARKS
jgi:anti-sigma factor RsiW